MLCPSCKTELTITERQGVEIDFCARCRGVWLDRGELDKIVDRSMTLSPGPTPRGDSGAVRDQRWSDDDHDDDDDRHRRYGQQGYGQSGYDQYGSPPRRKSWLGDLFDFG